MRESNLRFWERLGLVAIVTMSLLPLLPAVFPGAGS
jgi:hypothetical protein